MFRNISKTDRDRNIREHIHNYSFENQNKENLHYNIKNQKELFNKLNDYHSQRSSKNQKSSSAYFPKNQVNDSSISGVTTNNDLVNMKKILKRIKFYSEGDDYQILLKKFVRIQNQWSQIVNDLSLQNMYLKQQVQLLKEQIKKYQQKFKTMQYEVIFSKMDKIKSQYQVQKLKNFSSNNTGRLRSKQNSKELLYRNQKQGIINNLKNSMDNSPIMSPKKQNIFYSQSKSQLESVSVCQIEQFKILSQQIPMPTQLVRYFDFSYIARKVFSDYNSAFRAFYYSFIKDIYLKNKKSKIQNLKETIDRQDINMELCKQTTIPSQYHYFLNNSLLKSSFHTFILQIDNARSPIQIQEQLKKYPVFDFVSILFCRSVLFLQTQFPSIYDFKGYVKPEIIFNILGQFFEYEVEVKQANNNNIYIFKQQQKPQFAIYQNQLSFILFQQSTHKTDRQNRHITQLTQQDQTQQEQQSSFIIYDN